MKFSIFLHLLGVVIWVGGMFFAYMALRPAAAQLLEPPQRLTLWIGVFLRFFRWVWVAIALILASGLYMIMLQGGFAVAALHILLMAIVGTLMIFIFAHVYFAPFKRLRRFALAQDWKAAAGCLAQIRVLIGINLSLGLLNILIATLGDVIG